MTALPDTSPSTEAKKLRPVRRSVSFATWRTIVALILREMASSYGRSPGGYAWLILEPVLGILFMSVFFVMVGFKTPALGTNFAIFFATGILPFQMYGDISQKTAQAINFSKSLLGYPRVTYLDAIIARVLLAALTNLLVSMILFSAIRAIWVTRTFVVIDRVILSFSMALCMGLGVGLLNCFLMTRFQMWQRIWGIVTRPLFFVSGILIIYESIPAPWNDYFLWNPLMHVTAEMRAGFYPGYDAPYVNPVYVFGIALTLGLSGLILLRRYHRDVMEV